MAAAVGVESQVSGREDLAETGDEVIKVQVKALALTSSGHGGRKGAVAIGD